MLHFGSKYSGGESGYELRVGGTLVARGGTFGVPNPQTVPPTYVYNEIVKFQ